MQLSGLCATIHMEDRYYRTKAWRFGPIILRAPKSYRTSGVRIASYRTTYLNKVIGPYFIIGLLILLSDQGASVVFGPKAVGSYRTSGVRYYRTIPISVWFACK